MSAARSISYPLGVILAASGALCWSMGGALVRLTDGIDAWQIVFYRSATVLVCMSVLLTVRHGASLPMRMAEAGWNGFIAGLAVALAGLTFIISLFYTTVAQSIFMVGLAPFFSAFLGLWILRERVPRTTWFAMLIALIGMAVILYGASRSTGSVIGAIIAIYSAFSFSCYSVALRWGQRSDMTVALIWNALILLIVTAAALLLPTGLRDHYGPQEFLIDYWNLAACMVMGAIQLTLGLMLYTWGSRAVPAAQLSLIALVEPTVSPLWAWLAVGELPPIATFAGGTVILIAIAVQALFGSRNSQAENPQAARLRPAEATRLS
jgi:drug/metabolite transporter (DMT)-like permease